MFIVKKVLKQQGLLAVWGSLDFLKFRDESCAEGRNSFLTVN